jgi:branched-chain amino acid transport system ATP-binding protein
MLQVENLHTSYGKIEALSGISLEVGGGEIVALIGANGAGKTTALKTVAGLLRAQQGRIALDGRDITRTPAHAIVRLGVSLAPEGRRIFPDLTVQENLEMGAFSLPPSKIKDGMETAFSIFPVLSERRRQFGGTLSGGEQQMLAIGRALMSNPKLLLLDEPSLGLAPKIVETIFEIIQRINAGGTAILLVEQNANMALCIAARGYVIESGRIVLADTAQSLCNNERVRHAYLGISE